MTVSEFRNMVLSFPGTEENPHFDRAAFKVTGRRIYATLHEPSATVNMKLSLNEQSLFCKYDKGSIYAIANKWGLQGWTTFELKNLSSDVVQEALKSAYDEVFKTEKSKTGKSKKQRPKNKQ